MTKSPKHFTSVLKMLLSHFCIQNGFSKETHFKKVEQVIFTGLSANCSLRVNLLSSLFLNGIFCVEGWVWSGRSYVQLTGALNLFCYSHCSEEIIVGNLLVITIQV